MIDLISHSLKRIKNKYGEWLLFDADALLKTQNHIIVGDAPFVILAISRYTNNCVNKEKTYAQYATQMKAGCNHQIHA
jgi:hypothetical protein